MIIIIVIHVWFPLLPHPPKDEVRAEEALTFPYWFKSDFHFWLTLHGSVYGLTLWSYSNLSWVISVCTLSKYCIFEILFMSEFSIKVLQTCSSLNASPDQNKNKSAGGPNRVMTADGLLSKVTSDYPATVPFLSFTLQWYPRHRRKCHQRVTRQSLSLSQDRRENDHRRSTAKCTQWREAKWREREGERERERERERELVVWDRPITFIVTGEVGSLARSSFDSFIKSLVVPR